VTTIARTASKWSGVISVTDADCVTWNSLLIHQGTMLHRFGSPSQVVIPFSVREIGDRQFAMINSFLNLVLGEGVVGIGSGAFRDCTHLRTVAFPASLEVSGELVFS
jgi:hypothetical protein